MALYLDTSALVKLVADEEESKELTAFVGDDEIMSSVIARVELVRAVGRKHGRMADQAEVLLGDMSFVAVNRVTTGVAAWIQPWSLRSQDALHVASALHMGQGIRALVTYDHRTIDAGRRAGLEVASPGRGSA